MRRTRAAKDALPDKALAMNDPISAPDTAEVPGEWFDEVRRRAAEQLQSNCLEYSAPEKAARALWMLASGASKLAISKAVGIRRETITRLAWTHRETLETKRKEFSRKYAMAAEGYTDLLMQKLERLEDDPTQLDGISPDKLALTIGIMTDKAAMLSGMAGQVIENRKGISLDDAIQAIAAAKERSTEKARLQPAGV